MSKNIYPDIDLINSREYYGAYNSKDLYKGKSFNMAGEWAPEVHYFNDDFLTDFVSYNGALLSCKRSHLSSSNNRPELLFEDNIPCGVKQNSYWTFVLGGIPGTNGSVGPTYIPSYNESTGELSWTLSEETPNVSPMNIKGDGIKSIYDEDILDGDKVIGKKITIQYGNNEIEPIEIYHGRDGKDGLTIQVASTKVENPTSDMQNIIWLIPTVTALGNNVYEEWIVVEVDGKYVWERWGAAEVSVDLGNYYTKDQIDDMQYVSEQEVSEIVKKEVEDMSNIDGGVTSFS